MSNCLALLHFVTKSGADQTRQPFRASARQVPRCDKPLTVLLTLCLLSLVTPSFAKTPSPFVGPAIVLNTLWQIKLGKDYTTTTDPSERNAHPPFTALFDIPRRPTDSKGTSIAGVRPLYRLLNRPFNTDHMDSLSHNEPGYTTEGKLGYIWSNGDAEAGLSPIFRMYDNQVGSPNFGDHRIAAQIPFTSQKPSIAGYHVDRILGYGYARYPGSGVVLRQQSGGGVTIKANLAVGCAVWEWWWHGIQFINDYDYGRQLQVALYPAKSASALGEAGDMWGAPNIPVQARHPSPCVTYSAGTSSSGNFLTTAAIPLEWHPQWFGGGKNNPVIYPSVRLGKTITLDWIGPDGVNRHWPLALFETTINSPKIPVAAVEAPTGYLTARFNTYYYYRPSTRTLTRVHASVIRSRSRGNGYDVPLPASSPQAVILASGTSPTSPAMGVYINNPNSGFVLYDNSSGGSRGESGSNFVKWVVRYYAPISAGSWTYKTWIVTDTVQNVIADIDELYAWRLKSR